jgi:hypothetical protein
MPPVFGNVPHQPLKTRLRCLELVGHFLQLQVHQPSRAPLMRVV